MTRLTRVIRFIRHWHARIGVLAALFFLFLASTGLALNHTDALQLSRKQVGAPWLMRWYGLAAETPTQGYLFARGYFVADGHRWLMDGHNLSASPEAVIGAAEVGGMRYLATTSAVHIYQPDGSLVERLTGPALPAATLQHIGAAGNFLLVQTAQGVFASEDGLTWKPYAAPTVAWSHPQPLPAGVRKQIEAMFAPALPLERIVLDVHSGRVLGRHGPLVMDLAALVLMVLSLSGIWIYVRSMRKRHR